MARTSIRAIRRAIPRHSELFVAPSGRRGVAAKGSLTWHREPRKIVLSDELTSFTTVYCGRIGAERNELVQSR